MLNNEQDWRYGMRVKLLKRAVLHIFTFYSRFWNKMKDFSFSYFFLQAKHGQKKKGWREVDFDKNSNVHASDPAGGEENHNLSDHLDERHNEEVSSAYHHGYNEPYFPYR